MLIITYIRFHRHYPSIQHDRNFSYLAHPPSTRHDQSYRSWLIMFSLKGYSFLNQNGAKTFNRYHFYFTLENMATSGCQVSHLWGIEGFVYGRYSEWAFLDFRSFDFCNFWFNAVYNSILFSSPLVLLSNLDLRVFWFRVVFLFPHINSANQGMPV